jgi:hypothetical protein
VLTGRDLAGAKPCTRWPLARPPLFLETSLPRVFAAGEGAIAIQLAHEYLAEQPS